MSSASPPSAPVPFECWNSVFGCSTSSVPFYQSLIFLIPLIFTVVLVLLLCLLYVRSRHYYRRHVRSRHATLRSILVTGAHSRSRNTGLDAATTNTFPTILFGELKQRAPSVKATEEDLQCPVCLGEYQEGETLRMLPCHAFHKDCIDSWLRNHSTCPTCRMSLLPAVGTPMAPASTEDAVLSVGETSPINAQATAEHIVVVQSAVPGVPAALAVEGAPAVTAAQAAP